MHLGFIFQGALPYRTVGTALQNSGFITTFCEGDK